MKVEFPQCWELPDVHHGEVQTRSEETGLEQHQTLAKAVEHASKDKTVWKISYFTEQGWKRFVIR